MPCFDNNNNHDTNNDNKTGNFKYVLMQDTVLFPGSVYAFIRFLAATGLISV